MDMTGKRQSSVMAIILLGLIFMGLSGRSFAAELITQDDAPYSYEEANWRTGNYMQALYLDYSALPSLSENFLGKGKVLTDRSPDAYYPANTGIDLLDYCDEAIYTPIVRLDLIKRLFKTIYASHFQDADALWVTYSGGKRQLSSLTPAHEGGQSWAPAWDYPETKLVARNLPDTGSENLALVWPHVQVNGKWYDDAQMKFEALKINEPNKDETSFTTECRYTSPEAGPVTIKGVGWEGQQDRVLEVTLSMPADPNRDCAQLVFSNLTDERMGFSAPYPTEVPETIQLPDGSEISSKPWSVENPDYNYLIIYTKDADMSGFEYQNAMIFGWKDKPSKILVQWNEKSEKSFHEAYPGTEGTTDVMAGVHSGGYYRIDFEYDEKTDLEKTVWLERFQGVDPSLSLRHLHHIARNINETGHVGMPGYAATESGWLEEPVSAFPATAYVLAMFDDEEDQFGGDYSTEAVKIATQMVDDRIAMWQRGRKSSNVHEYSSGAYYLSLLYDLPGKFNDPQKRDYYKKWAADWADELLKEKNAKYCSGRHMMALWRVYELTGDQKYKEAYDKSRAAYRVSPGEGLYKNDRWISPRDFYTYGDFMAAIGRRGLPEDAEDLGKLITYLTGQKRWTDTGYMGVWWEVTTENHNFFGRWAKALGMQDAPKQFFSVSDFPVYYKKDGKVVTENMAIPPIYNPDYFDKKIMEKYLPVLPERIATSVIFRIENILLKRDYMNNWWVGTDDPAAVAALEKIVANMKAIKEKAIAGKGKIPYDENMKQMFAETDSQFEKARAALGNYVVNDGDGKPVPLMNELNAVTNNYVYLKNVIGSGK